MDAAVSHSHNRVWLSGDQRVDRQGTGRGCDSCPMPPLPVAPRSGRLNRYSGYSRGCVRDRLVEEAVKDEIKRIQFRAQVQPPVFVPRERG